MALYTCTITYYHSTDKAKSMMKIWSTIHSEVYLWQRASVSDDKTLAATRRFHASSSDDGVRINTPCISCTAVQLWLVHTADTDKTKLSCLVHVCDVNTTGDATKLSCLVCGCVHAANTSCLVHISSVNKPLQLHCCQKSSGFYTTHLSEIPNTEAFTWNNTNLNCRQT